MRPLRVATSDAFRLAPDERTAVALGRDVVLWDLETRKRRANAHPFAHPAYVDFAPDGSLVAVKSTAGELVLLEAATLAEVGRLAGDELGEGEEAFFSHCGRFVVDVGHHDVVVRDVASGVVTFHERADMPIQSVTHDPDRSVFAFAVSRNLDPRIRVRRWPFDRHEAVDAFEVAAPIVWALALRPGGDEIAVCGNDLELWSLRSSKRLARRSVSTSGTGSKLAWSPDGETLALAERHGIRGFDSRLKPAWSFDLRSASDVEWSRSGSLLAAGSWERGIVGPLDALIER